MPRKFAKQDIAVEDESQEEEQDSAGEGAEGDEAGEPSGKAITKARAARIALDESPPSRRRP